MNTKSLSKVVVIAGVLLLNQSLLSIPAVHAEENTTKWTLDNYQGASASAASVPWQNVEVSDATNLGIIVDMSTFLEDTDLDHVIGLMSTSGEGSTLTQLEMTFKYVDQAKGLVGLSVDLSKLVPGKDYGIVIYNPHTFVHLKYEADVTKQIDNKVLKFYPTGVNTAYDPMIRISVTSADTIEQSADDSDVNVQWIRYEWTKANDDLGMALRVQQSDKAIAEKDVQLVLASSNGEQLYGTVSAFEDKEYGPLVNLHIDKQKIKENIKYKLSVQYNGNQYDIPNQYFDKTVALSNDIKIITQKDGVYLIKSTTETKQTVAVEQEEKNVIQKIVDKIAPNKTEANQDEVKTAVSHQEKTNKVSTKAKVKSEKLPATGFTTFYTATIGVGLLVLTSGLIMMMKQRKRK